MKSTEVTSCAPQGFDRSASSSAEAGLCRDWADNKKVDLFLAVSRNVVNAQLLEPKPSQSSGLWRPSSNLRRNRRVWQENAQLGESRNHLVVKPFGNCVRVLPDCL